MNRLKNGRHKAITIQSRYRAERLPGGAGYHFHLSRPTQALSGSTEERAAQISDEIETLIRQCPEQYLWGYSRYKRPRGVEAPPESR